MVLYEDFKNYLLREELQNASFKCYQNWNLSRYCNNNVTIDYINGCLKRICIAGNDLSDYFPFLVSEDEWGSLYLADEEIRFVYNHAFPSHKN